MHIARGMTPTIVILLVCIGCQPEGNSFGIRPVRIDGTSIYFIREVRGMNYDSLVLSASSNVCQDLDGKQNYVFEALGPTEPYYKWDGRVLHIFHTSRITAPRIFPVRIELHQLDALAWRELEGTATNRKMTKAIVPLNSSLTCRAMWF